MTTATDDITAYLEKSAAELGRAAAEIGGIIGDPARRAALRASVAAGYERLAAIAAGLPPCRCYEPASAAGPEE